MEQENIVEPVEEMKVENTDKVVQDEANQANESSADSEDLEVNNKENQENTGKNKMQEIEIEKMVLNCGGTEDKLEKSVKLLELITKRKPYKKKATKRIPAFGISPGKESGCKVTLRDKEQIKDLLIKFFAALDNKIFAKQVTENHVSFGVPEYIEIPGLEYQRDIGILGFEASLVFKRKGKRVKNN